MTGKKNVQRKAHQQKNIFTSNEDTLKKHAEDKVKKIKQLNREKSIAKKEEKKRRKRERRDEERSKKEERAIMEMENEEAEERNEMEANQRNSAIQNTLGFFVTLALLVFWYALY